jgi:hypothetical protein
VPDGTGVTLCFPAATERVRLARVLAATLADEAGFDYDEVEDVRIAVDELCFAVLDAGQTVGTFDITAESSPGELTITGICHFEGEARPSTDETNAELTAQILGTVVDSYSVDFDGDIGTFSLRKSRS